MKKILLGLSILVLFSGCSKMSKIEKVSESKSKFEGSVYQGKVTYKSNRKITGEQYRVFHQASTGFVSIESIRQSAESRANRFCRDSGINKKMFTISERTSPRTMLPGNFPRIEIVFTCVDKKSNSNNSSQKNAKYSELSTIKELLDNGILTQQEFNKEKRKILSR